MILLRCFLANVLLAKIFLFVIFISDLSQSACSLWHGCFNTCGKVIVELLPRSMHSQNAKGVATVKVRQSEGC